MTSRNVGLSFGTDTLSMNSCCIQVNGAPLMCRSWFALIVLLTSAPSALAATVRYEVTFTSTWSANTHPVDFPAGAHFSRLIGGAHNASVDFWELGGEASLGIERMAELGSQSPLNAEVSSAIAAGNAYSVISGGGIGLSPGVVSTTFDTDTAYPLVTLVSMIAPSPDWFVGVDSLSLLVGGRWERDLVVSLGPYDAGTDSGLSFTSPDADTQPREAISKLTGYPFTDTGPLGTFAFRLLTPVVAGDTNNDGVVDLVDLNNVRNNFGGMGLGDTDGDNQVDIADLNAVRNNFSEDDDALPVPEPTTLALACFCSSIIVTKLLAHVSRHPGSDAELGREM